MNQMTSLVAVMTAPKTTELREIPIPDLPSDAGLLKVLANGVCGSDPGKYGSEKFAPSILGHEIVGVIEKLGDAARARWGVTEGDYVALEEYLACGHCDYCRVGEYRSCFETDAQMKGTIRYGSTRLDVAPALYGGQSQYLYLHPRTVLHRVPEGVAPHIAAMALPIGNGFQWTYLDGGAGPGKTVVIIGPGQQGFGCVVAAATAGADNVIIAGLSRHKARFETAMKLGATHAVLLDEGDPVEEIKEITDGRMADIVLEVSGAGPEIINGGLAFVKKRGTFLCTAYKKAPVPLNIDRVIQYQVNLKGTRGHSYYAVELALRAMKAGKIPVELISTHVFGLKDADHALRLVGGEFKERAIHVTIEPWK
jgi:threonine dehydrogenase-like Zn-dependent dehydrogenase